MKKLLLTICVLFFSIGNVFSQTCSLKHEISIDKYQVLDSAYLKCSYKLTSVTDTLKADKTRYEDMQTLLVGKKISKYFSQNMADYYLKAIDLQKKGLNCNWYKEKGTYGFEIFKNYPDNKMTVTDLGTDIGGNFLYEDKNSNMKWEIESDTSTILSYLCQKAVTTFRGRVYEAWFTIDIPINNGPWKFGGLPGLILKITDKKQYFVFECIGIEKLEKIELIKFYDLKYNKISRKNFAKIYQKYYDDMIAFQLANGIGKQVFGYTETGEKKQITHWPKQPYNPMELE